MNDIYLFSAPLLLVLLTIATCDDVLENRIPNTVVVWGITLALCIAGLTGGVAGLLAAIGGLIVGGALLLPLYLLGGMAAGDVKLMAMAGAFLGPAATLLAVFVTLAAGAILAVAMVAFWILVNSRAGLGAAVGLRRLLPACVQRMTSRERPAHVPYAVAIAVGSIVALSWPLEQAAARMGA